MNWVQRPRHRRDRMDEETAEWRGRRDIMLPRRMSRRELNLSSSSLPLLVVSCKIFLFFPSLRFSAIFNGRFLGIFKGKFQTFLKGYFQPLLKGDFQPLLMTYEREEHNFEYILRESLMKNIVEWNFIWFFKR